MNAPRTVEMPARIVKLNRDDRGYPVPWFVAYVDGKPCFPIMDGAKLSMAIAMDRCWICGGSLGRFRAYVIGPMCAVNRVSAEPPSHRDCAIYAAQACPFLTNPRRRRRDIDGAVCPAGEMIERNPGVALVWVTTSTRPESDGKGGVLFNIGEPTDTYWYAHGREATREEVLASIESGLPLLREMADQDGAAAVAELERLTTSAMELVPA